MASGFIFGEALLLGLASGPACLASCGPVLVPSMLAGDGGVSRNSRYLSLFLGARFVGYLLFACAAWGLGAVIPVQSAPRAALVFGIVHLLVACALLWYAHKAGEACSASCGGSELVSLGVGSKAGVSGPAALGFLTGLSLCPPFIAAGIRAAELGSVIAALVFFATFFVGTSLWFVPFLGLGCVHRNEAVRTVARMSMAIIAVYYACLGFAMLTGKNLHVQ